MEAGGLISDFGGLVVGRLKALIGMGSAASTASGIRGLIVYERESINISNYGPQVVNEVTFENLYGMSYAQAMYWTS